MPNFADRIPQGSGSRGVVGAYIAESLPNIKGTFNVRQVGKALHLSGAFSLQKDEEGGGGGGNGSTLKFNAYDSSSTYKDNAPVQQAATAVVFCIRY